MEKSSKIYSFEDAIRILGVSRSTLFLWMRKFAHLLPGAVQRGRNGWTFDSATLDSMMRIRLWLRNDGWKYEQVLSELERIAPPLDSSPNVALEEPSPMQRESNELIEQYKISTSLVALLKKQQDTLETLQDELFLAHKERMEHQEKIAHLEMKLSSEAYEIKMERVILGEQLMKLQDTIDEMKTPWYKKVWDWMNQPVTWKGRPVDIEIQRNTMKIVEKAEGPANALNTILENRAA